MKYLKAKRKRRPNAQRRVLSLAIPQGLLKCSFLQHILAYSWWYVDAGIEMKRGHDLSLHNRAQVDIAEQTKELEGAIGVKWSNKAFRWALKTAQRIDPLDIEALQNLQRWLIDERQSSAYMSKPYTLYFTRPLPQAYKKNWQTHVDLYVQELLHDMERPITTARLSDKFKALKNLRK